MNRISRACQTCRQRRKKCDGQYPCGPCMENNRTCIFTPPKRRGPTPRTQHSPPPSYPRILPFDGHPDPVDHRSPSPCKRHRSSASPPTCSLHDPARTEHPNPKAPLFSPGILPCSHKSGPSSPHSPCRSDLRHEVNVLSKNMTVVVSVDEHGGHAHISNHGHANALHLLRHFTRTFTPNARDGLVYIPDLVCCPAKPTLLAMHKILFPSDAFVTMLIDYYFDHIDPFLPFISRAKINTHLTSPTPSYILLYSLLSVATQQFERRYRVGPVHGVLLSHLLLTRAKELIQPILSSPTPCLFNIQALLLIEMADRESIRGAPWLISGMSIRMALDLGLNLGVPDAVKVMNLVSVPVWSKTWIYCCIVDSLNSFQTGRSHMISDNDSVQDLSECVFSKASSERYGDQELIKEDHFFVWLFKLFEITGKIGRTITHLRIRKHLPYSLPELHSLLSKYRSTLPKSLVYDFERPNLNSIFAIHLNLLYLGTVIFLYRSVFACNLMVDSPLRFEYMRILESSTDAILAIFASHIDTIHLAPLPLGYAFDLIYTVCVILITQKPAGNSSPVSPADGINPDSTEHLTNNATPCPLQQGEPPADSPTCVKVDSRNKPKAVRILLQCLQILDSLAPSQPLLRRHAALGKELLESVTDTPQDCDYDLRLLLDHLEIIKLSEAQIQRWSHDPLLESLETGKVFGAYLSVLHSGPSDSPRDIVPEIDRSAKPPKPICGDLKIPSNVQFTPIHSNSLGPASSDPNFMAGLLSHAKHQPLHDDMYASLSHHHLFHPFALPIAGSLAAPASGITSSLPNLVGLDAVHQGSVLEPNDLFLGSAKNGGACWDNTHQFDAMMQLLGTPANGGVPGMEKSWHLPTAMPGGEVSPLTANFGSPLSACSLDMLTPNSSGCNYK